MRWIAVKPDRRRRVSLLLAPYRWVQLIRDALAAGAQMVVCEGRATGTAGLGAHSARRRTSGTRSRSSWTSSLASIPVSRLTWWLTR